MKALRAATKVKVSEQKQKPLEQALKNLDKIRQRRF